MARCEYPECCSGKPAEFEAWVGHGKLVLMALCRDCVKHSRAAEAKGVDVALTEAQNDIVPPSEVDTLAEDNLALTNALHRVVEALGIPHHCPSIGHHNEILDMTNQCLEAIEDLRNRAGE